MIASARSILTFLIVAVAFSAILSAQTLPEKGKPKLPARLQTVPQLVAERAIFRTDLRGGPYTGGPEQIARAYLSGNYQQFGMKQATSDLVLAKILESPGGSHVHFRQTYQGIPVHQSDVVVSINKMNQVEFLSSAYKSNFAAPPTSPLVSAAEAIGAARSYVGVTGGLFGEQTAQLTITVQNGVGRLGYRVLIPTFEPRGDWEVFVDALTKEVYSVIDMTQFSSGPGQRKPNQPLFDKNLPILTARPAIQDLVNRVSAGTVTSRMRRLEAFKFRYVSSAAGRDSLAASRDWIIAQLQSYGYTDVTTQSFSYGGNTLQNIIATKPGTRYPDTMVVIGGHYDTVNGPGTDDNGSGTALTLEAARVLASKNFEYTIKFIFFSAEEEGLIGSAAYVQNVALPGNYHIKVMINADMIGYSGGGNVVKVEKDTDPNPPENNAASAAYTDTLAALTELYSTLTTQIAAAYGSDHMSFEDGGYVITGYFETPENPHYHLLSDSLTFVDTTYVTQITKGAVAGIAYFAKVMSGSGYAYDPDPLTTAHEVYTDPGYGDNNDADSPQLSAQRQLKTLPDLTLSGGVYQLAGPYVTIEDWDLPAIPPVTAADPDSFRFNRSQTGFEDVNVYFHVDFIERYIQSLGFTNIQDNSIHIDPHGFDGADNSAYYPSTNKIAYGQGGVDDAEDADVILHEYGHAIQNGSVPGWSGSGEQGSLGEGFGDYWAASYNRSFGLWAPTDPEYYWVFQWDGHNNYWPGRVLNYAAHYPEGLTGDIHTDGQIWASTLMNVWNDVGRAVLDRLVLQSHFYLASSGVTMAQNAQAVIQADRNLYGGAHVQILVYWFGLRGFINPADYVPSISHTPRGDSENPLGPYPVTALVYPGSAALDTNQIKVFWGRTGSFTDSIQMARTGNPNEWTASIPGNGYSATYMYYIQAKDVSGGTATHPANAPSSYHSFYVGDDTTRPVIVHTPLRNQPKLRWPPVVRAAVTDNLGVDTVWVQFIRLRGALADSFGLRHTLGTTYEASFALDSSQVQIGDTIQYRILARDVSLSHNTAISPPSGYYQFAVINTKGLVLVVDDDPASKAGSQTTEKGTITVPASEKGYAGRLMARTLTDAGYLVDTVGFAAHDPSVYPGYDIVVWTAGTNTSMFQDAAKRAALISRAASGGKIWVEGGEVGYVYRQSSAEPDAAFRRAVLHDSTWISDVTSSNLVITSPAHAIFNVPNPVTGPVGVTGTTYAVRDAMRLLPGDAGVYKIAGWSTYTAQGPDTASVIVYDNNPNPLSAQIVFYPFAVSGITDTLTARKLIENTAEFLMTPEPPPTGGITGVVSLTDVGDWSGVKVKLVGLTLERLDSLITVADGVYSFGGLYEGTYRVTVSKAGYYPVAASRDTAVGTTVVTNFNFSLTPILSASVSGEVKLADTTDYRGISVAIVGQGLSMVTDSTGVYSFTGVTPGQITVRASKPGYQTVSKDTSVANGGSTTVNLILPAQTVLIYETFETTAVDGIPSGWTRIDVNGDGNTWKTVADATYNHTPGGTQGITYTYNSSNAANDWLITPELTLSGMTPYRLSFWYRTNSTSYIEQIEVMYGTAPTPAALTNLVWRKEDIANTTFQKAVAVVVVPSTGPYYLGFHVYSAADQYNPGLDDIRFELSPMNDIGVTKLWVPLAMRAMDKQFTPPGREEQARILEAERAEARAAGKDPGSGYIPWDGAGSRPPEEGFELAKADSAMTLAEVLNFGLAGQASYNVQWTVDGTPQPAVANARPLPSGGKDTLRLVWHTPVVGLHPVVAHTDLSSDADRTNDTARTTLTILPASTILSESFESGTTLPPGWSTALVTPGGTNAAWTIITGTGTNPAAPPYTGTNQAKFNSYSANSGSQARLTSRRMQLPAGGVRLTFFMYHDPGYSTSYDSITVQATTGDSITGPWVRLGNFIRYSAATGWRRDSVSLLAFGGQAKVFVSFLGTSQYGNNMYLDEVNVFPYTVSDFVTVTSPNGGETWQVGAQQAITWASYGVSTVNIDYSTNNGSTWISVATGVPAKGDMGTYPWTVPNTQTTQARVRVTSVTNPSLTDMSDGPFSIVATLPPTWAFQASGTASALNSVSIVSDQVAWAVGTGGVVVKTTNGGAAWQTVTALAADAHQVAGVSAAVALACVNPAAGNDGRIYRTTDGGASWAMVYQNTGAGAFIDAVYMFNATNGVAVGDPVGGQWILLRTTNGGANWAVSGTLAQASGEAGWNNSFDWANSLTGWFGTSNYRVYRTTDGGSSWSYGTTASRNSYGISFISNALGMIGDSGAATGRTTNGGATWTSAATAGTGSMLMPAGVAVPTQRWWMTSGTAIYKTTDQGTGWTLDHSAANAFNHIQMKVISGGANMIVGYAVGVSGQISKYLEYLPSGTGSISGALFEDADGDSVRDAGEPALVGWKTYLTGAKTDSAVTDTGGIYMFTNLAAGAYTVSESLQTGWMQDVPGGAGVYSVVVTGGGDVTGKNFGNYRPAAVSGTKFDDVAGDSLRSGDPGLPGWKIYLVRGAKKDSATTDTQGAYTFAGLLPGSYAVSESLRTGWVQTMPAGGGYLFTAVSGQSVAGRDFGNFKLGTVAGLKWKDKDGNGLQEPGEPPLSGWTIRLTGQKPGNVVETTTGGSGGYLFTSLAADIYTVSEVQKDGYTQTCPPNPGTYLVTMRSGLDTAGLIFGNFYPDTTKYRTFSADSITYAKDNKGKVAKAVKRRADKVHFKFRLTAPVASGNLSLDFSMDVRGAATDTFGVPVPGTLPFVGRKIALSFSPPLASGAVVQVEGWGKRGSLVKVRYAFGMARKANLLSFMLNQPGLPMPNSINMVEELFKQGAFSSSGGMVVGKALSGVDLTRYGSVKMAKSTDLVKSMYERGRGHQGVPRMFDLYGGRAFLGLKKNCPWSKHDNKLFAELAALRLNIVGSGTSKLPLGFGDLLFDDGTGSPFCGKTVAEIASLADTFITYGTSALGVPADSIYGVVLRLNQSFLGALDTSSFAPGVVFTGVRPLADVPFLKPNLGAKPTVMALENPGLLVEEPVLFTLYQNYPNPFNPTTTISFDLPEQALVSLKVYDMLGREVATLYEREMLDEGAYAVEFSAGSLASGVYFYRLVAQVQNQEVWDSEFGPDGAGSAPGSRVFTDIKKLLLVK